MLVLLAALLWPLTTQASPPLPEPVVLLHGFDSHPRMWRGTERLLRDAGFEPIAIAWRPEPGMRVPQAATQVVLPAIRHELARRGYRPDAPWSAVGHSTGGLVLRWIAEHPHADADAVLPGGFWGGDGEADGDPALAARLRTLVMLSTPSRGARTGVARIACDTWHDAAWRELACDLIPGVPLLEHLGARKPDGVSARYLAIGVETAPNLLPAPLFDGNGDGLASTHDNSVMAESGWLAGAPFVIWRGRKQRSHFTVSCSSTLNAWIVEFLDGGPAPVQPLGRQPSEDICGPIPEESP